MSRLKIDLREINLDGFLLTAVRALNITLGSALLDILGERYGPGSKKQ